MRAPPVAREAAAAAGDIRPMTHDTGKSASIVCRQKNLSCDMIVGRFCLQILFGRVGIRSTFLCQCCEVTSLPQTTEIKIEKGRNDTKAAEKLRKANTLTDSSGSGS